MPVETFEAYDDDDQDVFVWWVKGDYTSVASSSISYLNK